MDRVPVYYATTDGQTRRIAERIADILRERGLYAEAADVASHEAREPHWDDVTGVVLGASLRYGRHQRRARRFAQTNNHALNARPSAFFSVSLSAASKKAEEVAEARRLAERFVEQSGWRPGKIACFAGRLAYTRYGFLTRYLMKRIAAAEGGATDTTRDHELTNWSEVESFARAFADQLRQGAPTGAA